MISKKNKDPLIYTIERSGTNFIAYCFNHIFPNIIVTHNKNKKFTDGEDIDYKDYKIFATIRSPRDIVVSEIYSLHEDFPNFSTTTDEFIRRAEGFLSKQKAYLKDLIDHEDFYIMPFEYFTRDTYNFFVRLAQENNFSGIQYLKIKDNNFFKDPLKTILENDLIDKKRVPRDYKDAIRNHIQDSMYLQPLQKSLLEADAMYNILLKRYNDGQTCI